MKKAFLPLLALLIGFASPAQNVAVNSDGLQPAASAMLDSKSSNKSSPAGRQAGLLAQDLQQVFPEPVQPQVKTKEKKKQGEVITPELEYLGVYYTGLLSVNVGTIQELKNENEALKAELRAIKTKPGMQ